MTIAGSSSPRFELFHGDCIHVLPTLPYQVDAIVCDPPYGLGFMGKAWDHGVPAKEVWQAVYEAAKPGAFLLAFAGTRTYHRMACAIEDAGFELRDMIGWLYGSGFPKSHNLDGERKGWGTALKPAFEPIVLARKPLIGTVAANVLQHGTGALNIDGCRVPTLDSWTRKEGFTPAHEGYGTGAFSNKNEGAMSVLGRWPANILHDGSEEVQDITGSAARFFYCAKASKRDRDAGLEGFDLVPPMHGKHNGQGGLHVSNSKLPSANTHPTVKPTDLMRYLCRLITPPDGLILDPFMGSGSTGKAAIAEGFRFVGIEREADYIEIARARIAARQEQLALV